MVESFDLDELEVRLALLPLISRGTHLAGPRLHAERLVELWAADGPVPLAEAFRLLPVEAVAGVLLRVLVTGAHDLGDDWAKRPRGASHWSFPPVRDLLPGLYELIWSEALAGRLVVTAIALDEEGERVTVFHERLLALDPDWERSRLYLDGRTVWVAVQVEPIATAAPAVVPAPRKREFISEKKIKAAVARFVKSVTDEEENKPSGPREFHIGLEKHLGAELGQKRAAKALKTYAPQWYVPPGRLRKNNSAM